MNLVLSSSLAALLVPALLLGQAVQPRQTYGPWQLNKEKGYFFRKFEFKVNATDKEFRHEYVIFYKEDPKKKINNQWVYFYNPTTEKFWARYPTTNHAQYGQDAKAGKEVWSLLQPQDRQKDIYAIDPKAWPAPKLDFCPPIPMSADNVNLLSPPADLP